jgi:hypothetical protein
VGLIPDRLAVLSANTGGAKRPVTRVNPKLYTLASNQQNLQTLFVSRDANLRFGVGRIVGDSATVLPRGEAS